MRLKNLTIVAAAITNVGCAGKQATPAVSDPSRNIRVVQAGDSRLFAIATAAARSLEPGGDWPAQFTGISIGGRELKALGDSIARAAQVTLVGGGNGKVPYVIAREGSGGSPEVERARRAFTYAFTHMRATPDSAYVGGTVTGGMRGDRSICIALVRAGSAWLAAETTPIRRAQDCGG